MQQPIKSYFISSSQFQFQILIKHIFEWILIQFIFSFRLPNLKAQTFMSIILQSNLISNCSCFPSDYQKRSLSQGLLIKNSYQQKLLKRTSRQATESNIKDKLRITNLNGKIQKKSLKQMYKKVNPANFDEKMLESTKIHSDTIQKEKYNTTERNSITNQKILRISEPIINGSQRRLNHREQIRIYGPIKSSTGSKLIKSSQNLGFNNKIQDVNKITYQHSIKNYPSYNKPGGVTFRQQIQGQIEKSFYKKMHLKDYILCDRNSQKLYSCTIPVKQTNQHKIYHQVKTYQDKIAKNTFLKKLNETVPAHSYSQIRNQASKNTISSQKHNLIHQNGHKKFKIFHRQDINEYAEQKLCPEQLSFEKSYTPSTQQKSKKKICKTKNSEGFVNGTHHKQINKIWNPKQIQSVFDSEQNNSQAFSQVIFQQDFTIDNPGGGFLLQSLVYRQQQNNYQQE